jgi:filamentous hemagglutinin family protein
MFGIFLLNLRLHAEVVTDGTVGAAKSLVGPDFIIGDNFGQQVGENLFHSFKDFNINTNESATFTGPNSIINILARVTGGNRSLINGMLSSDIPNSNLYLLNPSGILFGENATLNITGSFHASTADYLRLGKKGIFSAIEPNNSVFVSAPPEAFGFLNNNPASISIQGSRIIAPNEKTISMIGGDLQIEDSILFASGGRINLASVASAGEVIPTALDLGVKTFEKLGKITLSESSSSMLKEIGLANIDVTDHHSLDSPSNKSGQIFIRAGQFFSDKGYIFADTLGNNPSQIDIFIDGDMHLTHGARITADNYGEGQGGNINITTNTLRFSGQNAEKSEDNIDRLSTIATNNLGVGTGGEIHINTSLLEINPGLIQAATASSGNAGGIVINAENVLLNSKFQDGGLINAGTTSSGLGGNITIIATDEISLLNSSISSSASEGSEGSEGSSGNAGNIYLDTRHLILKQNGQILNASFGSGNAGSIKIITDNASFRGMSIVASLARQGNGGKIDLSARHQLQIDNSFIVTRTTSLQDDAGDMTIGAETFFLNRGELLANAIAGEGGNIDIRAAQLNIFGDSWIDVSSRYGINGALILNDIKLTEDFMVLPPPQFQEELFRQYCKPVAIGDLNQLIVRNLNPLRIHPEDLQTYHDIYLSRLHETTPVDE